jgi:phage gp29-like protein
MPAVDFIRIRDDTEVETHFIDHASIFRFSYWREARRFAWKVAHENQLAVVANDRHGWAIHWERASTATEGSKNG